MMDTNCHCSCASVDSLTDDGKPPGNPMLGCLFRCSARYLSLEQYSLQVKKTVRRKTCAKKMLRETCVNLREQLLMMMVGAGWVACCFAVWLPVGGGLNLESCPYRILCEILRKLAWALGCSLLGAGAMPNAEKLPLRYAHTACLAV